MEKIVGTNASLSCGVSDEERKFL